MRIKRLLVALMLAVPLAGCGPESSGQPDRPAVGGGESADSTPRSAPPIYQVPDSDCPTGWAGLGVTTESDAEVEYLDDITACMNSVGDTTYLKNRSDAVWTLRSISSNSGTTTAVDRTLTEASFVAAVRGARPGQAIFAPGAELTVDLPPEEVEWVIDLPLSIGWEGHGLVLEKIRAGSEAAAVAALRRQSRTGAALGVCTLAAVKYAETVRDLDDADAAEVVLKGLGVSAATSACYRDAAEVSTVNETGRSVALAEELERLRGQTDILERVERRVGYAQRASKVLQFGLKLLP